MLSAKSGRIYHERMRGRILFDGRRIVRGKTKITTKEVPPDISAVKLIMEEMHADKYQSMNEEELLEEKQRLLKLLKEAENATNDGKTQN